MWDEESVKNLSLVSHINFISICSLALHCLRSELGTFVDWKTDWGSVVLTVVVVWFLTAGSVHQRVYSIFVRFTSVWKLKVHCLEEIYSFGVHGTMRIGLAVRFPGEDRMTHERISFWRSTLRFLSCIIVMLCSYSRWPIWDAVSAALYDLVIVMIEVQLMKSSLRRIGCLQFWENQQRASSDLLVGADG